MKAFAMVERPVISEVFWISLVRLNDKFVSIEQFIINEGVNLIEDQLENIREGYLKM